MNNLNPLYLTEVSKGMILRAANSLINPDSPSSLEDRHNVWERLQSIKSRHMKKDHKFKTDPQRTIHDKNYEALKGASNDFFDDYMDRKRGIIRWNANHPSKPDTFTPKKRPKIALLVPVNGHTEDEELVYDD